MASQKLTDFFIKQLAAPAQRTEYFDPEVKSLALRVTPQGTKSFVMYYRVGSKQRCITLGKYPAIGLKQARDEARAMQVEITRGGDPLAARDAKKYQAYLNLTTTTRNDYEAMVDLFVKNYLLAKGRRSWREVERALKGVPLKHWCGWEVEKITRQHVSAVIEEVFDSGKKPIAANRLLAALRRFFNWLAERGTIEASPALYIKPPGEENRRERVLNRTEIKRFLEVTDALPYPWKQRYQLALVTAQRGGEVMKMKWADIDEDRGVWTIPAEDSKNKTAHEVPLSSLAKEILATIPRIRGEYVFTTRPGTSIRHNGKVNRKLYELCGFDEPWLPHDLRRTPSTLLAKIGIQPHIIDAVTNHKSGVIKGVSATYIRHPYLEEKRDALERLADELRGIRDEVEPRVVKLKESPLKGKALKTGRK
ncbi:MAG: tyrosine-type recombinase/integrase [Alphaproteobacteria bacterium]